MNVVVDIDFIFSQLGRNINKQIRNVLSEFDITELQWMILEYLYNNPGAMLVDVAKKFQMQPISITRIIDKMESMKWVVRVKDAKDRRAIRVYMNAKYDAAFLKISSEVSKIRKAVFDALSKSEIDSFIENLNKIKNNLLG